MHDVDGKLDSVHGKHLTHACRQKFNVPDERLRERPRGRNSRAGHTCVEGANTRRRLIWSGKHRARLTQRLLSWSVKRRCTERIRIQDLGIMQVETPEHAGA